MASGFLTAVWWLNTEKHFVAEVYHTVATFRTPESVRAVGVRTSAETYPELYPEH